MASYKIHVRKGIWADEERTELFDRLYRDIELPFVPSIGLAIQHHDGWSCDPIERLVWNEEQQLFTAETRAENGNAERTAEDIRHWDLTYCHWLSDKKKTEQ